MSDIKRLGDIEDMDRFLEEDCYCPKCGARVVEVDQ